jgi:hypothetical protein
VRYQNTPDATFTTSRGKRVLLKDNLPLVERALRYTTVTTDSESFLDEIASRDELWGEGSESMAYKIFDENITELFENNFDLGVLQSIRIPQ